MIRRMFYEIDAECYIMVDGDDTYLAEYGRQMTDLVLKRQVDMVVRDRLPSTYFKENKRPLHNMGNTLVRGSINRLFKTDIRDIMTGYRALSYLFVKTSSDTGLQYVSWSAPAISGISDYNGFDLSACPRRREGVSDRGDLHGCERYKCYDSG